MDNSTETVRLQKHLEQCGIASRRHAADIIKEGRVKVNDVTIFEPGFRVSATDVISFDGRTLGKPEEENPNKTIIFYKPRGFVCSTNEEQGDTIYKYLRGIKGKLSTAGRLDKDSEGLLILSTDGELINTLTHPKFGHTKEYIVEASGRFSQYTYDKLNSRMEIDGYMIQPAKVDYLERLPDEFGYAHHLLRFTLTEGRNLQIRKMCAEVNLKVNHLMRVAINRLELPEDMAPGEWRDITPEQMSLLLKKSAK